MPAKGEACTNKLSTPPISSPASRVDDYVAVIKHPRKKPASQPASNGTSEGTSKAARPPTPLYILSDSTGNLARHMVTTYLTQFPAGTFVTQTKPFLAEPRRMNQAFLEVAQRGGIVLHAVVQPALKADIATRCRQLAVPCYDLTGQAVEFLAGAAGITPLADEDRLHQVDHVYCGRINAMSFTLEHDDGLGLETLAEADIVLAGVSRTGKTPTSMYLALLGFRVANVSVAMGAPVPEQLLKLPPGKVVGLTIDPSRLVEIRNRRHAAWRMNQTQYNDPRAVAEELQWCRQLFTRQLRCAVLEVTDQAIEETAARVLDLLGLTEPTHRPEAALS
jgi:[pyruvate, water dikinase]-phosphate phosphotransferase / [pyruvate, water dikinase] kinase